MFENVDGRTDDGVTGILIAHLGAFRSGELKIFIKCAQNERCTSSMSEQSLCKV